MKTFKIYLIFLFIFSATAFSETPSKVAILEFENRAAKKFEPFVQSVSHMLTIKLKSSEHLMPIKQTEIERHMQNLGIKQGEMIDKQTAVRLSKSLGADILIKGNLSEVYRLESLLIDAKTGNPMLPQAVKGDKAKVIDMIDELAQLLAVSFGEKKTTKLAILAFENNASDEYKAFVRGISSMIMLSLEGKENLVITEAAQVEKAMRDLGIQTKDLKKAERASQLRNLLGVDVVVSGNFREAYRLEAELIDVRTKKIPVVKRVMGGKVEITSLVDKLAKELMVRQKGAFKIAVLYFDNNAPDEYRFFVRGISDMLMTALGQSENLTLIERTQIDKAMQNFKVEMEGPINAEQTVKIGEWLGADAMVLGSFTKFGNAYRIDARMIDARTGKLIVGEHVKGGEGEVITLVDQLGKKLIAKLDKKEAKVKGEMGILEIKFRIVVTPMTERRAYHHICKLYVDDKYLGESKVVEAKKGWKTTFTKQLTAGKHKVEVSHGYVKKGAWGGKFNQQPKIFFVTIKPNSTTLIKYEYEIGWIKDEYEYAKTKTEKLQVPLEGIIRDVLGK